MGQYYNPVILKKNWKNETQPVVASLKCYDFDNGAKLMEHSYVGNRFVEAMMHLLHILDEDRSGFPFVWCGDYADTINTPAIPQKGVLNEQTGECHLEGGFQAWSLAYAWMEDKDDDEKDSAEYAAVKEMIKDASMHNYNYILNHTKKEYVKVPKFKKDSWIIHPLPILTSDGNGKGSGDYSDQICINPEEKDLDKREYKDKPNKKFVGAWAYDTISVTNKFEDTKGYKKIDWEEELAY
jgi:hypothetical protein